MAMLPRRLSENRRGLSRFCAVRGAKWDCPPFRDGSRRGAKAVSKVLLLTAIFLPAAGCGKPAPPPAGAPQSATTPTVDLGTESGPQDSAAGSSDSTPAGGTPAAEQGEPK